MEGIYLNKEKFGECVCKSRKEEGMKKIRMKLTVGAGLIIGLLPLLLIVFSYVCFYLIKDGKSIDDALLTLVFIIIAAILFFIRLGMPILGFVFTKIWNGSNLMSSNRKLKKIICVILYLVFGIWLVSSVISNIVQ